MTLPLVALTCCTVWLAAGLGAHGWQLPSIDDPLVTELRLPRIMAALLVGASLAASGAALQALFRNPLADPALIGTSSGAALGVVAVIAGGVTGLAVPFAAFAGGLLATVVVLLLNRLVNGGQAGLLIIGVVVGAFCGAVISLLMLLSDDMTLRGAMAWLAGNLSDAGFSSLGQVCLIMAAGLA
jgi:iron complex transport system permease protein